MAHPHCGVDSHNKHASRILTTLYLRASDGDMLLQQFNAHTYTKHINLHIYRAYKDISVERLK